MQKSNKRVLTVLLLSGGLMLANNTGAQDASVTLQQAIERAKENYPSIKAASLEIDRQKALKTTAYDLGSTSIFTGKEETGNGSIGIQNQFGIAQTGIDVFGIPSKSRLGETKKQLAVSKMELTEKELVRDVSIAWYRAFSIKKQWQLYLQLDSIYANFLKAAELRYKTQQTSRVEYLSASVKYRELTVKIKQAESEYRASLQRLNQYILFTSGFEVEDEHTETGKTLSALQPLDSMTASPLLNFYKTQIATAKAEWQAERAGYLPKFNLGYTKQTVDGQSGFYEWEAGISMPLLFFLQSGKTRAARIDFEIAAQDYRQKELELNATYNEMLSKYETMLEVLDYYENEALPLASEQMDAASLGYRLGNLDYIQFIQNMESAIKIRQEYLLHLAEYFELKEQLKYISGK